MNQLSIVIGADRPDLIRDETLADLFAASAQKYADKTALIFTASQCVVREMTMA